MMINASYPLHSRRNRRRARLAGEPIGLVALSGCGAEANEAKDQSIDWPGTPPCPNFLDTETEENYQQHQGIDRQDCDYYHYQNV